MTQSKWNNQKLKMKKNHSTTDHNNVISQDMSYNLTQFISLELIEYSLTITCHSTLTSNIYKIDAANESDHDTIKIVIQNRMDFPNKAQWYMNNELTDNPKYIEEFTKEWNKKWTNSISKLGQWEQIKIWIRNFTIKWTKENKTNPNT